MMSMRILIGIILAPILLGFLLALVGGDPRWSCWSPLPQLYGEGCGSAVHHDKTEHDICTCKMCNHK